MYGKHSSAFSGISVFSIVIVLPGQTMEAVPGAWYCMADHKQMVTQELNLLDKTFSLIILGELLTPKSLTAS